MSSKASASPGRPRGTPRKTGPRNKRWSSSGKKKKSSSFDGSVYFGLDVTLETRRGDEYTCTVTGYNARRARWTVTRRDDGEEEEVNHGMLLMGIDARSDPSGPDRHVGRRVTRTFDKTKTPYHGTVDGADEREGLWHVKFDDGDEEEVDLMELLFAADLHDRLHGVGVFAEDAGGDDTSDSHGGDAAAGRRQLFDGHVDARGEIEGKVTTRRNFTVAVSFGVALLAVAVWYARHASADEERVMTRVPPPPGSYRGRRPKPLSFDDGW